MRHKDIHAALGILLPTLLLLSSCGQAAAQRDVDGGKNATTPGETAEYRRKLKEHTTAHDQYDAEATAYWSAVVQKRRARNSKRANKERIEADDYVLTQPPRYTGPPKPIDPSAPPVPQPPTKYVPVVADFLASAKQYFDFVPKRPRTEMEFKRAYVRTAAAAGLTRDQIVRGIL